MMAPGALRLLWILLGVSVVLVVLGFLLESWTIPGDKWWEFWKPKAEGLGAGDREEDEFGPGGHGDPDYVPTPGWSDYP